ncbi:hypothetical protein [Moraxella equi]|uniref:Uncharacterized protein n=2 Tax=Moraxella equi TaxID=60442 RepID=A0A378QLT1_9GAMM|nr:hypothetical protein [Moraxella equi]STZ01846.1 Uncharacterised protein [Moraxella equi]
MIFTLIFMIKNRELAKNPEQFIEKAIIDYYDNFIDDIIGINEAKWCGKLLTNFNEFNLSPLLEITNKTTPSFFILVYGYGYPKNYFYFICGNDINPNNPAVFKTNQEIDFNQVEKVGTLSEFFNGFLTKQEARIYIQEFLDDVANGEVD